MNMFDMVGARRPNEGEDAVAYLASIRSLLPAPIQRGLYYDDLADELVVWTEQGMPVYEPQTNGLYVGRRRTSTGYGDVIRVRLRGFSDIADAELIAALEAFRNRVRERQVTSVLNRSGEGEE